ncbi:MAG: hypothetical protein AAGA56_13090 [Myxococcota bacterium]
MTISFRGGCSALLALLSLGCSEKPEPRSTEARLARSGQQGGVEPLAVAATTRPAERCFSVRASRPDRASAALRILLSDETGALGHFDDCVLVQQARVVQRYSMGAPIPSLPIKAHPHVLQRIHIGSEDLLLHVAPGAELRIREDICFGWSFAHLQGDAPAVIRLQADPNYRDGLTLRMPTEDDSEPGRIPDPVFSVPAGQCGFHRLATASDRISLAPASGATWTLAIDAQGKITGRRQPAHE